MIWVVENYKGENIAPVLLGRKAVNEALWSYVLVSCVHV